MMHATILIGSDPEDKHDTSDTKGGMDPAYGYLGKKSQIIHHPQDMEMDLATHTKETGKKSRH